MTIHERQYGDVVILDLRGADGATSMDLDLWRRVGALAQSGRRKIVLNLERGTHGSAPGVSTLLAALVAAHDAAGEVKLLRPRRPTVAESPVALYDHFEVFESEPAVLASFTVPRRRASAGELCPPKPCVPPPAKYAEDGRSETAAAVSLRPAAETGGRALATQ